MAGSHVFRSSVSKQYGIYMINNWKLIDDFKTWLHHCRRIILIILIGETTLTQGFMMSKVTCVSHIYRHIPAQPPEIPICRTRNEGSCSHISDGLCCASRYFRQIAQFYIGPSVSWKTDDERSGMFKIVPWDVWVQCIQLYQDWTALQARKKYHWSCQHWWECVHS